jgi:hypothetical protein
MKLRSNISCSLSNSDSSLIYRAAEFSFDTIPPSQSVFASLLINDLNLDLDESGKILSVWGLCPYTRWRDTHLTVPKAACGEVFVVTDASLEQGVSLRLTPAKSYLSVLVDRSQGWLKVQDLCIPKSAIMIMSGVIFEIGNDGEFCALWLHPQSGIIGTEAETP